MDAYQRYQLELPMDTECYECSDDGRPILSLDVLNAVQDGNVEVIQDYLDKDGNVNALCDEECLLSRACSEGKVDIVKLLLLQCSDIHLNIKYDNATPLNRAARNGHIECVKILLDATVACNIQLDNNWKTIAKCLRMQPTLQPRSATHILRSATRCGNWDVLQLILETKHHFVKEDLYHLLLSAVNQNRWNIAFSVFKRDFYGKTEVVNEVLGITVNMRIWEKVKEVLHVLENDLEFDVAFVEAALSGKHTEVQRLLAEGQYDSHTQNGNLLVVAAGGMSDSVAELLMTVKKVYTKKTFANALFLAAQTCCAEILPKLLHNPEASYTLSDLHQANEVLTRLPRYDKREGFLVTYFNEYLKKS